MSGRATDSPAASRGGAPNSPANFKPDNAIVAAACLSAIVACALLAFYALFSTFMPYDDEGLFLRANLLFLEGYTFYSDIPWTYGPVYLASVQLLHDVMGIPLTNSALRFITLGIWLLLAAICGWLVQRLARSWLWGLTAFLLCFLYLDAMVKEPGHPQGLVAIGMVMIPLIATFMRQANQLACWLLIGLVTAAVAQVKLNAGVYTLAAVAIVMLSLLEPGPWRTRLLVMAALGSLLFPFMLMFPLLGEANSAAFALILGLSAAAVAVLLIVVNEPDGHFRLALVAFLGGFAAMTLGALVYAGLKGATVFDIVGSLLQYSESQLAFYHFFSSYSYLQMALALVSFLIAINVVRSGVNSAAAWKIIAAKSFLVAATVYALATDSPATSQSMLGYAAPWCWVLLIGHAGTGTPGRSLLAATAAWAPLLAYPMPGSQLYFGSLGILLIALVCAADLVVAAQARWSSGTAVSPALYPALVALLFAFAAISFELAAARSQYKTFQPLALPGTEFMRVAPRRGGHLRELVAEIDKADVVLTTFRFNSLYTWSDADTPFPGYLPYYSLAHATPSEQRLLATGLRQAVRPVIVTRAIPGSNKLESDQLGWLGSEFSVHRKIGPYTLLRRTILAPGSSGDH